MRLEHWVYTVPLRLRSLFRRRQVEAELDEELRFHVERQAEEYVRRGMTPNEARRAALVAFGGVERHKEGARDARGVSVIENVTRDLRYALRTLGRAPGFAVVAAVVIALGVGATAAIFTVVDAVLLKPLPYREPARLVTVGYGRGSTVAPGVFLDWAAAARSFERMGLAEWWQPSFTGGDRPEELRGIRLTSDMLPMLGFTDDAAVLATAIRLVASHITPEHREAARAALERARGSGG